MNIKTVNRKIATEPFKQTSVQTTVTSGFGTMDHKSNIVGLKVLFHSENLTYAPGDTIYVDGDVIGKHQWARNSHKINEVEFILIPEDFVLAVEQQPFDTNAATVTLTPSSGYEFKGILAGQPITISTTNGK